VALLAALFAALLAAAGFFFKQLWSADRSGLTVRIESPRQAIPIVGSAPMVGGDTVFYEAVRLDLLLSHDQNGKRSVRVTRLGLEHAPLTLDARTQEALEYEVDVLGIPPYGIVALKEYAFVLNGSRAEGTYLRSRDLAGAVTVDPGNIFESVEGIDAVSISPEGNNAHFQAAIVLEAGTPGLYRARFRARYDVAGKQGESVTSWIYLYLRQADRPVPGA
jgi:hypothetical protein